MRKKITFLFIVALAIVQKEYAQTCSLPGTTPDKAFPVCATTLLIETRVTNCKNLNVASVGCGEEVSAGNSFWYKFTCYQTGTLGFLIYANVEEDDYNWVLFDVTGHDPNDVFKDHSLQISLNLYAVKDPTRAPYPNSPTGCAPGYHKSFNCGGSLRTNSPFNQMPIIKEGHNYLLMVTNWTESANGYGLKFTDGTASIADPKDPHLENVRAICDGTSAVIRTNKKMKCSSVASNGSDFTIDPPIANVIAASGYGCSSGFDMDSLIITLDRPIPPGNYTITIRDGSDFNTLKDNCNGRIPAGESLPMVVYPAFPIPMDSISKVLCAPDELQLVFAKGIRCTSIAADGSDFRVSLISGTSPVSVVGASGNCTANGSSPIVTVKLSAPIQTKGTYAITLVTGNDGNTLIDECAQQTPAGSTLTFQTKDTVNADFTYNIRYGCISDTVDYFHDARNEVNSWKWDFDNLRRSNLQDPAMMYAAFGIKRTRLVVTNGVCKDTSDWVPVFLNNELASKFEATKMVCPNDQANFVDQSIGNGISWFWDFGNGNTSILQQPPQQSYMPSSFTRDVLAMLEVTDYLGCKDTSYQPVKVPNHCYIAVPNAFTPNGDGVNDELYPINAYKATDLIFRIYNRFGQLLFETRDWTRKWNGKFKGQGADPGTYVWMLQYTNTDTGKRIEQKGTTILIR